MAHYAKVENGVVTQVIVAEQDVIDSGIFGHGWVQTSYNTIGNTHTQGKTPLRGNYAGIGYTYDQTNDVFYAPQPFPSWVLNNTTWTWESPIQIPNDGRVHFWNEDLQQWIPAES
jgi:hypothetical protein